MKNSCRSACALLGGAFLGAAVAMLTAPKNGEQTRRMIRRFAEEEMEKIGRMCRKKHPEE